MDVRVPLYYIVSRLIPREQADPVLRALEITPVMAAIVSDVHDANLGYALAEALIMVNTETDAMQKAKTFSEHYGRPFLVIGEADFLDAIYTDGSRECVAHSC